MDEEHWAQLVSLTDLETQDILIYKDKFVIGRSPDADLPHEGNKLVSGKHCYIERDSDGKVWLYDTSTNGTLLNMTTKMSKGECRELSHGDEIYVVYKKNNTRENLGYMFQDIAKLKEETSSDNDHTLDYTQEENSLEATQMDDEINEADESDSRKRKSDSDDERQAKVQKTEESSKNNKDEAADDSLHKTEVEKTSDTTKTAKIDQANKKEVQSVAGPNSAVMEPEDDAIAESLVCIICQELLYDSVSLQPCMHSYCGGCYSEWMEQSNECPQCRLKVDRINKNHIVNNLVEAYLKVKPGKKRPDEDLRALDAKNKITRDMLYPKKTRRDEDEESGSDFSDEEDEEEVEEEPEYNPGLPGAAPLPAGYIFGAGTPLFGTFLNNRPNQTICRQCPNYNNNQQPPQQTAGILRGVQQGAVNGPPVDPDAKTLPEVPDYTCAPNGNHVLCLCCMNPMPDRRREFATGTAPPQQCSICLRSFCHAYWGCLKADCNGCLARLKDMNFGKKCLVNLLLDNPHESLILKNYLDSKGLSVRALWRECLEKYRHQQIGIDVNAPRCYACAIRLFKDFVYQYRKEIPNEELPQEARNRSDCYWGKNCRTQRNKPEHAKRFNHICEQTRTS